MIDSYEKEKFEIGKTYYTYFMETTNKGNSIRNWTGIFEAKLENIKEYSGLKYTEFSIKGGKFSDLMKRNINAYLDGYGSAFCYFLKHMMNVLNIMIIQLKTIQKA